MSSPQPTLAGFTDWVYAVMGVPQAACPSGSAPLSYAYDWAKATVNVALARVAGPIYQLAVYNLGGDLLVNWAPDVPGVEYPTDNPDHLGYFAYLRQKWDLNGFVAGVINSSADEGTSESLTVAKAFEELQISDLQNLKTPWGRAYLGIAQKYGTAWGLTR